MQRADVERLWWNQEGEMASQNEKRAGVRVFRGAEAPELHESGATTSDFGGNEEFREVAARLASSECSSTRLLVHQSTEEGGMSVVYLYFKPNFPLFRHMHDVDSLYVIISGSVVNFMGEGEILRPGDSWSVKAGTPYFYSAGPEGVEVLEMFHDADHLTVIYTDNPDDRLEEAEEAVRVNAAAWSKISDGPLFAVHAAGS